MHLNQKLIQSVLRKNFSCFIAKSFFTVSPGVNYLHNWHIDAIANKLQQITTGEITRLIINIPPRNLKSICVSVAWPAWLLAHNPSTKIMASSYSQTLSNKHSLDCRLIMNSSWYKNLFPNTEIVKGENQKSKFVTNKRGFRFATSTGGTATGEGGDILIVDDPQNPSKINSKKYRNNTIEWFEQTFISRLNNKNTGAIVIVMQRLHEEDLCGYLLKNHPKQWDLLKLPAIDEASGIPLHKERDNLNSLNKLKLELGEYNFSAQYQQSPSSNKYSMVNKSWLKYFKNFDELCFTQIIQSWDTAIKAKDEHDYSAGITIGVTNNNNYYILDVLRVKAEFPELVNLVQNYANKWKPKVILIEDKASGQSLIQTLTKLPIISIKPKFDKITRFASNTTLFEAGKIFIKEDSNWKNIFETEILTFPKSTNDDQVDALSQAFNYLKQRKIIQLRNI